MNNSKFRKITSSVELSKIIKDGVKSTCKATIWTNEDQKEKIYVGHLIEVSHKDAVIIIGDITTPPIKDLSTTGQVNVQLDSEHLTFKTTVILIDKNELILNLPEHAIATERRLFPRRYLSIQPPQSITFYDSIEDKSTNATILDYSNEGVGLYIEGKNISNKDPRKITLTHINNIKIESPELADIVFITEINTHSSEKNIQGYRIGIKIDNSSFSVLPYLQNDTTNVNL